MSVTISPLELILDTENPRFVVLKDREQADIRKYLVTYEDACTLAHSINEYGGLYLGERIVTLFENGRYIVVEGNRRTCVLQMLLSRVLIPNGFGHKIPEVKDHTKKSIETIEVDILHSRDAALELMAKRHIEGVKQWQPIAKKQFFAANYSAGRSVKNLSDVTGIEVSEINGHIRDYRFFMSAYEKYMQIHPTFENDVIKLKITSFLRIFEVKLDLPTGEKISCQKFLKIHYDAAYNIKSELDGALFNEIVQLIFYDTVIAEHTNTRSNLNDITGIAPLLERVIRANTQQTGGQDVPPPGPGTSNGGDTGTDGEYGNGSGGGGANGGTGGNGTNGPTPGGPTPGGPSPRTFFETISWRGKLNQSEPSHQGLLAALDELYRASTENCSRSKVYKSFPVATGMILRTVYEQTLILRLKQVTLWGTFMQSFSPGRYYTLNDIETFIKAGSNKATVLPNRDLINAFDKIIASLNRAFLNDNIHNPGNIRVHPDSLESISAGGMFFLIQSLINLLP